MLVAISQRNDENKHGDWIDNLENNYINYLQEFGIELLVIPNTLKNVGAYLNSFPVEAIILSGGNDIDPKLYGGDAKKGMAISEARDNTEKQLLEIAIDKKLPVLGICRGMQFINVFFKGKLVGVEDHVANDHGIDIDGKRHEINSYHSSGISEASLGDDLEEFTIADDGIIEGIKHKSMPIAGIQWHPERKSPDEHINKKIIEDFINKRSFWK